MDSYARAMMSRNEQLCFFDVEVKKRRRKFKRYRKPPELLPFSVRLTGLSGAVRVEAYLKQQRVKENRVKEALQGEGEPEQLERVQNIEAIDAAAVQAGAEQNQAVLDKLYKLGCEFKKEKDITTTNKTARDLPNLQVKLRQLPVAAVRNFEQLEGDDEEEDTQRFLFEENKFAAPNLLAQLGKLLDFLHGKQVEEFEDSLNINAELDISFSVVKDETETLRSGGVILQLPDELNQKLSINYEGLSANAVYVKREWQTASYREQAILQKRLGTNLFEIQQTEASKTAEQKLNIPTEKASKQSIDSKTAQMPLSKDLESIHEGTVPSILSHRRDSKASNVSPTKFKTRTRLEKFKFYADKDTTPPGSQGQINVGGKTRPGSHVQMQGGQTREGRTHGGHSHGGRNGITRGGSIASDHVHFDDHNVYEDKELSEAQSMSVMLPGSIPSVINFSLLSKYCSDKGWVVPQSGADDLERQTMIEWARARLLQVIKERDEASVKAKELGEDGPVLQKCYGDAQLEAAMKYKKGVSWVKRMKKMTENDKKSKFLISVPDGTTFSYYPSGRLSLCAVKPGPGLPGKYTFAYGDSDSQPMLATFTPSGFGCCYNEKGGIRFVTTPKFGSLYEEDGSLEKKWRWPLGKLQTAVVIQMNKQISLRCTSQSSIILYFNCQNETTKFPVGMAIGAKTVKIEELGYLQTDCKFTSLAAQQSIKVKPKKKDKKRRGMKQSKTDVITEEVIEERQKELEEKFPERKEIDLDAPWQLELSKLQRKVKNLVYDWMDFYRISVGIVSPKRALRCRSMSHSAKSLPGSMPSSSRRGTISRRAPSAPPNQRASELGTKPGSQSFMSPIRSHSSSGDRTPGGEGISKGVTIDAPRDGTQSIPHFNAASLASGTRSYTNSTSRLPFRCGVIQQARSSPPRKGCSVALHSEMLGEKDPQCRCDRRRIPLITDLEYDIFLREHVARTQMIVVSVTSSIYPDANPCDSMLDQLFYEKNRDRSIPCVQARNDPFRLLRYDIATATINTDHDQSLLLTRHNAVPGMFLMYVGGKLLFADHIFNGYGNAKKDFLKQIMKTRKDSLVGKALPYDFRLTPSRGRSGPRSAWGGEIGGPKITSSQLTVSIDDTSRITSASTDNSKSTVMMDNRGGAQSAASFIKVGLSINSPYPRTGISTDRFQELPKLNTVA